MTPRTMFRVANDEWPAVSWFCAGGPTGDVRGILAERVVKAPRIRGGRRYSSTVKHAGGRVYIVVEPSAGGTWTAALVYYANGRGYWRRRNMHPTLRAALRDMRRHLAWELAGAVRDTMLMPDSADWSAIAGLTAVAREWAA